MSTQSLDLPQGTLDLLLLKAVALEPQHGWAIAQRLHQISSATLQRLRHMPSLLRK
jgi:PadR family transcriptional regulator PadR